MLFRTLVSIYALFCFAAAAYDMTLALTTDGPNGAAVWFTLNFVIVLGYGLWAVRLIYRDLKRERLTRDWSE